MMRQTIGVALVLAAMGAASCGGDSSGGNHKVFFVGYVYDGATGARLSATSLMGVSLSYGDTKIKVDVQDDGRFVSRDPLPTWRDYTVTVTAPGYRAFVSYNPGIDVPVSLAMTDGIAQASTTQTLDFAAYLFPVTLKSPALTLTVTVPDSTTALPVSSMVSGTFRLRPQSLSNIQIGGSGAISSPSNRIWFNDEDLLTQTVVKSFTNGSVTVDEGELVYGVSYEVAIYDVDGQQPLLASGGSGIMAGLVTSRTFALTPAMRDPLAIVATDAAACVPPAGTDTSYGGRVTLTFNADIEVFGSTYKEDFDNALSITAPTTSTTGGYYCPLKSVTVVDPTQQERGSRVEVSGKTLVFSFNPSVGLAATYFNLACVPPPAITSVNYAGATALILQPTGDPARRRALSEMLFERRITSVVCPTRTTF